MKRKIRRTLRISLIVLIAVLIVMDIISFIALRPTTSIIGNNETLKEIDRLLLPVALQNITAADFSALQGMVKSDSYARDEVKELIVLTNEREYSHIGHGLISLHDYIKTGNESICPGHLLAHYYIFTRHNETGLAKDNLAEAKDILKSSNMTLLTTVLNRINAGNTTTSDEEISELVDAPCL
ncbi:hypothetical protein KW805_03705 [Candidatus Pacearchaeota archaeon]|nr:hypothetical protein [Candidatus Pacearchaeota archaeon]